MNVVNNERGLTLIEILAVVTIIALIAVVIGGGIFEQADSAKFKLNEVKLKKVQDQLGQYRLISGKYPSALDSLRKGSGNALSGYIPTLNEKDLKDVWDSPFKYSAKGGGVSYSLTSLGSDGKTGGEGAAADVTVEP